MGKLAEWLDTIKDPENILSELELADLFVSGLLMFEIGGAAVEILGIATPVLAWGAGIYEFAYGLRNATKKDVKKKAFARGYAIGVVAAVVGVSGHFVKMNYWLNTATPGFLGDMELAEIGTNAHNLGLATGYRDGKALGAAYRKKMQKVLIMLHHKKLEAQGRDFVDPGNDADRILMWAGSFRDELQ